MASASSAVHPGHRVLVRALVLGKTGHAGVEVTCPFRVHEHGRSLYRQQPQDCLEDDAGEAHATAGGREHVAALFRAALDGPARSCDSERVQVPADRAVQVMILAVYVARDRAAERDESRPRRDGREQPPRNKQSQELVKGHAGLGAHPCPSDVEI